MITRGTTVTHTFTVPFTSEDVKTLIITYQQGDIVIEKTNDDVVYDDENKTLTVVLAQEETLRFMYSENPYDRTKNIIQVQMRVKYNDGTVYSGQIIKERLEDVLNQEIIL